MKILITIFILSCILAVSSATTEAKKIEQLLAENTKELSETKQLLQHIDNTNDKIKASIDQQRGWLDAIKNVEALLAKLNQSHDAQSKALLDALQNVTLKSGLHAERVVKELGVLSRLQLSTKQQISGLEQKLDAYQKHVLQNARSIDNSILGLTKLITRAVLPQLNGLQSSFNSLETSHINIEVELKSLPRIKDLTEDSNRKVIVLGEQLASVNRTATGRLSVLSHAVSKLKPLNTWQIESALRELIISQKRIELDLESCQKRSASHYAKPHSSDAYPTYEVELPSRPTPTIKPSNPSYTQYAAAPVKPERRPNAAHGVSWQQPLPWEAVGAYQSPSGPGLIPRNNAPWQPEPHYRIISSATHKAYQPSSDRRRPSQNPPPSYGPQYQQHGSKQGTILQPERY